MPSLFKNRRDAGRQLADALVAYRHHENTLVLALPRGGVPVAYEVAVQLALPLDVWLVRKLGVPGHEELAMGALAMGNIRVLNYEIIEQLNISSEAVEEAALKELAELERRNDQYRGNRPPPVVEGKTVIVVDDGLATGATMKAAVAALRQADAAKIIVAAPVGAVQTTREVNIEADVVVCLKTPEPFYGVGRWYADFSQITDREVQDLLAASSRNGNRQEAV